MRRLLFTLAVLLPSVASAQSTDWQYLYDPSTGGYVGGYRTLQPGRVMYWVPDRNEYVYGWDSIVVAPQRDINAPTWFNQAKQLYWYQPTYSPANFQPQPTSPTMIVNPFYKGKQQ